MSDLFHPIAELFPSIEGEAFEALKADIKANGLREPIWLFEGRILDGRNRYNACDALDLVPDFRDYMGNAPLDFALSLNLHRRHLSESQRAMVAAKLATFQHGGDRVSQEAHLRLAPNSIDPTILAGVTQEEAAEKMNVSKRSVTAATKVRSEGVGELATAVEQGKVSLSAAATVASLPEEAQRALVAAGPGEIKKAAAGLRKGAKQVDSPGQEAHVPLAPAEHAPHGPSSNYGPSEQEVRDAEQAEADQLEYIKGLLADASDPLAQALADIKQLRTVNAALKSQNDGYQNTINEQTKMIKSLRAKVSKLEKQTEGGVA